MDTIYQLDWDEGDELDETLSTEAEVETLPLQEKRKVNRAV